jgi:hypothetical protein
MRVLFIAAVLALVFTASLHAYKCCSPNSSDSDTVPMRSSSPEPLKATNPTYRVCLGDVKTIGDVQTSVNCRECQLKAAKANSEAECHDFFTADAALRFWKANCCD